MLSLLVVMFVWIARLDGMSVFDMIMLAVEQETH